MLSKEVSELLYRNVRAVLETAQAALVEPHPLWSDLNEIMEQMPRIEKDLGIVNCWESTKFGAR